MLIYSIVRGHMWVILREQFAFFFTVCLETRTCRSRKGASAQRLERGGARNYVGHYHLGPFHILGFADAVTQNLLTQNCVASPFEPSVPQSQFADAVTQRRKAERRAVSRAARARATPIYRGRGV